MDKDLFEYEMKKAGYRTTESRAEAMGVKISAYHRRMSGKCECSKAEIGRIADILGQALAWRIFFGNEVS
jgi:hypothetical protein